MEFRIRFLAAVTLDESPAELPYCIPPITIEIVTATPTKADRKLMNGCTYCVNKSQLLEEVHWLQLLEAAHAEGSAAGSVQLFTDGSTELH